MWGTRIPMELRLQWKGEPQGVIIIMIIIWAEGHVKFKWGKLLQSTTVTQCVDLWVGGFVCPRFSQHKG